MIDIIPNWHPIFVHFTVALFSTSVGFYILAYLFDKLKILPKITNELEIVAHWCLWMAGIIVIGTVLAGLYAYNTVRHDGPSHLAMTDHRNWALPTAGAMILVALWSLWRTRKQRAISLSFLVILIIVQCLLLSTAWRGAELVFRYGLGVISIPQSKEEGHHHSEEMMENKMDNMAKPTMESQPHKHAE